MVSILISFFHLFILPTTVYSVFQAINIKVGWTSDSSEIERHHKEVYLTKIKEMRPQLGFSLLFRVYNRQTESSTWAQLEKSTNWDKIFNT